MAYNYRSQRRKYSGTKRGPVQKSPRRYVRGYGGGRPGYGTMARNAWPFRSAPTRRPRFAKRKFMRKTADGNFTKSTAVMKHKGAYINKLACKMTADHTLRAQGAKRIEAAAGLQAMWSHTYQQGTDLSQAVDGTHVDYEFFIMSAQAAGKTLYKKLTKLIMTLANPTNANMQVDIYDLEVKDNAIANAAYKEPVWYLRTAWDQDFNAGDNTDYVQVRQGIPTGKNIFTDHWKINKKTTVNLNPGQVHTHKYNRYPNKRLEFGNLIGGNEVESGAANTPMQHIKGITYAVMVIVNGFPINDVTTKTLVNYSQTAINCTWHHTSVFHVVNDNSRYYNYATNSLDPVGTITTTSLMNDDSGAVTNFAAA